MANREYRYIAYCSILQYIAYCDILLRIQQYSYCDKYILQFKVICCNYAEGE